MRYDQIVIQNRFSVYDTIIQSPRAIFTDDSGNLTMKFELQFILRVQNVLRNFDIRSWHSSA